MRELKILNKNYEVANLYTVVYEGYTIKEIIEDAPVFSVTPPQHYLDYWQKVYDYFKTGTKVPGYTYLPQGQSKYDVAYTNKTIDDPIVQNNNGQWLTLRNIFENGNPTLNKSLISQYGSYSRNGNTHTSIGNTGGGQLNITSWYSGVKLPANFQDKVFFVNTVKITQEVEKVNILTYTSWSGTVALTKIAGTPDINNPELDKEYTLSYLLKVNEQPVEGVGLYSAVGTTNNTGVTQVVKDFITINITSLGIDFLSYGEILDYYFLYQFRKNITKKLLTYADIYENSNGVVIGLENWLVQSGSSSLVQEIGENHYKMTVNSQVSLLYQQFLTLSNAKFYYYGEVKKISGSGFAFYALPYNILSGAISEFTDPILNQPFNEWIKYSDVVTESNGGYKINFGRSSNQTNVTEIKNIHSVDLTVFDELITKEQLDSMLAHYLQIKNIVIYPEIYIPTDPTGFGNRYSFSKLNKKVYGHELDFDNMQLNLLFGVYKNAYDSYNQLMNFMIGNEGIISYDYGKGVRYSDIRLIKSPKTELDDGRYLKEKFDFKRLTPFYTLEQGSSLTIKNTHDWDLKLIVSGTVNTNIVYIEAEETTSGLTKTVKFDFTAVTRPFNFYYNSETKQILINGINNGYQYIDFTQGISFITLPKDTEHLIWTTGITSPSITVKKWVID